MQFDYKKLKNRNDRILCNPENQRSVCLKVYDWIAEQTRYPTEQRELILGKDIWRFVADHFLDELNSKYDLNGYLGVVSGTRLYAAEFFRSSDLNGCGLRLDEFPRGNEIIPSALLCSKHYT